MDLNEKEYTPTILDVFMDLTQLTARLRNLNSLYTQARESCDEKWKKEILIEIDQVCKELRTKDASNT